MFSSSMGDHHKPKAVRSSGRIRLRVKPSGRIRLRLKPNHQIKVTPFTSLRTRHGRIPPTPSVLDLLVPVLAAVQRPGSLLIFRSWGPCRARQCTAGDPSIRGCCSGTECAKSPVTGLEVQRQILIRSANHGSWRAAPKRRSLISCQVCGHSNHKRLRFRY
jgi:hypothetical protein